MKKISKKSIFQLAFIATSLSPFAMIHAFSSAAKPSAKANGTGLLSSDAWDLATKAINVLNNLVMPLIITLMVVMLLVGIFQQVLSKGSKDAESEGKKKMMWGIIGLFVAFTIWGFVGFLRRSAFGNNALNPVNQGLDNPCPFDSNGPLPGC